MTIITAMTPADWSSNTIALVSLLLAVVALRRTTEAQKREREAIVVIRNAWHGTPGIDDQMIPPWRGKEARHIHHNPQPEVPDQRLAIDGTPTATEGLELRRAHANDDSKEGATRGQTGTAVYRVMLEVKNVGRWSATGVRLRCTVGATYTEDYEEGVYDRTFPDQLITFDALEAGQSRFVEIRNMIGLPAWITFDSVSATSEQSIRIEQTEEEIWFQPWGYR